METPQCESSLLNEFLDIFEKEIDIMVTKEFFFIKGNHAWMSPKKKKKTLYYFRCFDQILIKMYLSS